MLRILTTCAAIMVAGIAQADSLRIVVPFSAGGAQDTLARWFAQKLDERTDFQVFVENKPGASGTIAANEVAHAPTDTDQHTVLAASGAAITIAPHMGALTYDPLTDFVPIASTFDTPMTLAVRADSPFQNLEDVIAAAKDDPGGLPFASTGFGSISHLTGELLAQAADIELLHIPYQGAAPGLADLLGGDVPLMVTSAASIEQHVSSGAARVLVVFSPVELSNLADVPTVEDTLGVEGLNSPVWGGYLAPAAMSPDVVAELGTAIEEVCNLPETAEMFKRLGATNMCGDAERLEGIITQDYERWGRVIEQGGLRDQ